MKNVVTWYMIIKIFNPAKNKSGTLRVPLEDAPRVLKYLEFKKMVVEGTDTQEFITHKLSDDEEAEYSAAQL